VSQKDHLTTGFACAAQHDCAESTARETALRWKNVSFQVLLQCRGSTFRLWMAVIT
jgi:hypothetical protein